MIKIITKTNQTEQPNDFHYWQQQSPGDRLKALENIRQEYHQWKYNAEPRLQRIYRITQQKPS